MAEKERELTSELHRSLEDQLHKDASIQSAPTAVRSAQILMLLSSLCAAVTGTDSSYLTRTTESYHWSVVLLSNGVIGSLCQLVLWCWQRRGASTTDNRPQPGILGNPCNRGWLVLRGVIGACGNTLSWVAMRYMDVAAANTIMFTSPVFTGLFCWVFLGQRWKLRDWSLCIICLAGVVLVARPPWIFGGEAEETPLWQFWLSLCCCLAFSMCNAAVGLVINAKLRDEANATCNLYMFLMLVVLDLPVLALVGPHGLFEYGPATPEFWLLFGVGAVFSLLQYARTAAYQISKDLTVVNMLYMEIVFCFLFGTLLLRQPLYVSAVIGASLIALCSIVVSILKNREERSGAET